VTTQILLRSRGLQRQIAPSHHPAVFGEVRFICRESPSKLPGVKSPYGAIRQAHPLTPLLRLSIFANHCSALFPATAGPYLQCTIYMKQSELLLNLIIFTYFLLTSSSCVIKFHFIAHFQNFYRAMLAQSAVMRQ